MLKLDFYASDDGETIILTFPGGGIAVVDAHPSASSARPPIMELVRDRDIHFVCLTHPHRDHGADLIPVLERHPRVEAFWHTVSDVDVLVFLQQQVWNYPNYPSACREAVERMKRGWAEFIIDLYSAVAERKLPRLQLRSDDRPRIIDGVKIHVLSPEQKITQRFVQAHGDRLRDFTADLPDPNLLSAILAFEYGGVVAVLGSDALKDNWQTATRLFFELELPKAVILKVPHHGAANALKIHGAGHTHNYLDICSRMPRTKSVLFAGDAKHPAPTVFKKLLEHTDLTCVSNGLKCTPHDTNPMRLQIPGARAAAFPPICNPVVSFTINPDGVVSQTAGSCDKTCGMLNLDE